MDDCTGGTILSQQGEVEHESIGNNTTVAAGYSLSLPGTVIQLNGCGMEVDSPQPAATQRVRISTLCKAAGED